MNLKKGPWGVFSHAKNADKKSKASESVRDIKSEKTGKPSLKESNEKISFPHRALKMISRVFFYFSGLMLLIFVAVVGMSGFIMEKFGGIRTIYTLLGLITVVTALPLGVHLGRIRK